MPVPRGVLGGCRGSAGGAAASCGTPCPGRCHPVVPTRSTPCPGSCHPEVPAPWAATAGLSPSRSLHVAPCPWGPAGLWDCHHPERPRPACGTPHPARRHPQVPAHGTPGCPCPEVPASGSPCLGSCHPCVPPLDTPKSLHVPPWASHHSEVPGVLRGASDPMARPAPAAGKK